MGFHCVFVSFFSTEYKVKEIHLGVSGTLGAAGNWQKDDSTIHSGKVTPINNSVIFLRPAFLLCRGPHSLHPALHLLPTEIKTVAHGPQRLSGGLPSPDIRYLH